MKQCQGERIMPEKWVTIEWTNSALFREVFEMKDNEPNKWTKSDESKTVIKKWTMIRAVDKLQSWKFAYAETWEKLENFFFFKKISCCIVIEIFTFGCSLYCCYCCCCAQVRKISAVICEPKKGGSFVWKINSPSLIKSPISWKILSHSGWISHARRIWQQWTLFTYNKYLLVSSTEYALLHHHLICLVVSF